MTDLFDKPTAVDENPGWGYITEWYCDPPAHGEAFRVLRDEWDEGHVVRCIFEWEPQYEPPTLYDLEIECGKCGTTRCKHMREPQR